MHCVHPAIGISRPLNNQYLRFNRSDETIRIIRNDPIQGKTSRPRQVGRLVDRPGKHAQLGRPGGGQE